MHALRRHKKKYGMVTMWHRDRDGGGGDLRSVLERKSKAGRKEGTQGKTKDAKEIERTRGRARDKASSSKELSFASFLPSRP